MSRDIACAAVRLLGRDRWSLQIKLIPLAWYASLRPYHITSMEYQCESVGNSTSWLGTTVGRLRAETGLRLGIHLGPCSVPVVQDLVNFDMAWSKYLRLPSLSSWVLVGREYIRITTRRTCRRIDTRYAFSIERIFATTETQLHPVTESDIARCARGRGQRRVVVRRAGVQHA